VSDSEDTQLNLGYTECNPHFTEKNIQACRNYIMVGYYYAIRISWYVAVISCCIMWVIVHKLINASRALTLQKKKMWLKK